MATVIETVSETDTQHIGKSALCQLLGWSRPTLDLRLDTDPLFPVAKRGVKGGGWAFAPAAVMAYLKGTTPAAVAGNLHTRMHPGAEYSTAPVASGDPVAHAGEQTARQRRDQVQAEILEDKLRLGRGDLMQAEVMRQVITKMLVHLGKGMDRLADQVVEKLGLPEENADAIRELTDDLRTTMVAELQAMLLEPESRNNRSR